MANIPGVRFDITGASGSTGLLGPKDAWKAYVFPRGGHASADSTGSLITFDSAAVASRFSVNDWLQAGTLVVNLRKVTAVGGNSLSFGGAVMTVTENQRIFRIGTTQPSVVGGSATYIPLTTIRQRGDDSADTYTNSMVTTNSDGLVQFYTAPNMYDVLVQDGNQSNQGYIADLEVGTVEGVSVTDWAFFGSTVTFHGAIGITGWATFGSTVTMQAALGVTGAVVFGATLTVAGGFSGTAIIPRLGPISTPTSGGAIRIVEGNVFPLTVAGVQAALNECKSIGGGKVIVPANAGIVIGSTSVKIPNKVVLSGAGSIGGTTFTFVCNASTNVTAVLENENQDGTQQAAAIENISIDGNKASGATATVGIKFVSLYSGTYIRSVRIINVSGTGIHLSGPSAASGPYFLQDITVSDSGLDNILVQHSFTGMRMCDIDSEDPGTGYACIRLQSDPTSVGRVIFGALLENIYVENSVADATSYGIVLDGTQGCSILNYSAVTTVAGNFGAMLRIQKTGTTAPYGNRLQNFSQSGTQSSLVDDNYAGVSFTNTQSSIVSFYESPTIVSTDAPGYNFGLRRKGPAQSSATTLTLSRAADVFEVTGTSVIRTITLSTRDTARPITLIFTDASPGGLGTGGNIRLAGGTTWTPAQWDAITLICSGTTWFEGSPR